jgi:hypothetical protein
MRSIVIALLLLSGCYQATTTAAPSQPSVKAEDIAATIRRLNTDSLLPSLPDDFKKPDGAAPVAAEKVEITVWGPKGCEPCNKVIAEGNKSTRFKFVKRDDIPAWVKKIADDANQGSYPIVTFPDKSGRQRYVAPWRGLKEFEKRYDKAFDNPIKAASVAGLFYGSNPSGWTWPGNLRSHLREHGYTSAQIARMSDSECIAAHDREHNRRGIFGGIFRPARKPARAKGCPSC